MTTLYSERLIIYPASDDEMLSIIARENVPELKQAYSEMLEGCTAHPEQRLWYCLWFMKSKQTSEIIGSLDFKGLTPNGMVEIGYGTEPAFQHQGYMTEAVKTLVEWAMKQPGVRGIEAETESDNRYSQRVLEKTGFVPMGIMGEEGPRYIFKPN